MSIKVELSVIMKFFSIFTKKRWTEIAGHDEVLRKFGELIETMDENQVNLLLELTEQYTWMSYNDYHSFLRSMLIKIYKAHLATKKNLFIFPIIKPEDEDKTKSGHAVMYMLDSIIPSIPEYGDIKSKVLNLFEDISGENLELKEDDFLILVDDFIGSGNTLEKTINEITKNDSLVDKYAVASVVIQENALNSLNERKIECIYGQVGRKGITGFYNNPILEEKLETMKKIEDRIPKVEKYRLGYEKSEALVTLIRTPNNTFPVFWKDYSYKGKTLKAPFARY